MQPTVENMQLREIGSDLFAEADFLSHRISVRCVYDATNWCWVPHVFLVTPPSLIQLTDSALRLRATSRLGAAHPGYAVRRHAAADGKRGAQEATCRRG